MIERKKLKALSNADLVQSLKNARGREREALAEILHHLAEIESRKLYAEYGHSSLFAYCVRELGYDESSASRRVNAARALHTAPEMEQALRENKVNLSSLSHVQRLIARKEHHHKEKIGIQAKRALFNEIKGRSTREAESFVLKVDPSIAQRKREMQRVVTQTKTAIRFEIETQKLERLRILYSNKNPNPSLEELMNWVIETALDQKDPKRREARREKRREVRRQRLQENIERASNGPQTGVSKSDAPLKRSERINASVKARGNMEAKAEEEKRAKAKVEQSVKAKEEQSAMAKTQQAIQSGNPRTRAIPKPIRDRIALRDQGRCQYTSPLNGRKCGETAGLHVDHALPYSLYGDHSPENLQLLCRKHNSIKGQQTMNFIKEKEAGTQPAQAH